MAIRLSGLTSGMDTETIIKELMSAQSIKRTKIEQKKTKLEWKKDKWSELNTKIMNLYREKLSDLRFEGNYATKKVSSSNENVLTATASSSASFGSHSIEVTDLASAQSVTGGKIEGIKSNSKLSDLLLADGSKAFEAGDQITVTAGSGDAQTRKILQISEDTTVQDFIKTLENAGLNASLDEKQGRFYISSKESGKENNFSIETNRISSTDPTLSTDFENAQNALKSVLGSNASSLNSFYGNYQDAYTQLKEKEERYTTSVSASSTATDDEKLNAWNEWQSAKKNVEDMQKGIINLVSDAKKNDLTQKAIDDRVLDITTSTDPAKQTIHQAIQDSVNSTYYKLDASGAIISPPEYSPTWIDSAKSHFRSEAEKEYDEELNKAIISGVQSDIENLTNNKTTWIENKFNATATTTAINQYLTDKREAEIKDALKSEAMSFVSNDTAVQNQINSDLTSAMGSTTGGLTKDAMDALKLYNDAMDKKLASGSGSTILTNGLHALGLSNVSLDADGKVLADSNVTATSASNAEITMDGVSYSSSSNSITAAGITLNLLDKTKAGEKITINVTNNTQETYDMIKKFITSYNEVLLEMNKAYSADSAKGYDVLTSEEKEAMTDKQIELWEEKVKGSLLRRDDTLGNLTSSMRNALQTSIEVDGKKYSLASLGIRTGDWTEKGLLHIYGDSDDPDYSDQTNVLMNKINEDPELVAKVISGVTKNLYNTLQDKMKSTTLSSALTFYNDKDMKKQIEDYEKDMKKWDKKLKTMEDKYYKQFSAMEVAMAKLNNQSSSLNGLFG